MGMPINSYAILKALADKGDSPEKDVAEKALKPFNLFALILHDRVEHRDFDQFLNQSFDRLDYVTGEKLLFFALCDPPEEWILHAYNRHYYNVIRPYASSSYDSSSAIFAVASALNIPVHNMPCIVITQNLKSPKFLILPSNSEKIENHLSNLGYFASRMKHYEYGALETFVTQLHNNQDARFSSLYGSLAKSLSEVLELFTAVNNGNQMEISEARKGVNETILKLLNDIQNLKRNIENSEEHERLDGLCMKITSFLSILCKKSDSEINHVVRIKTDFLELESKYILNTAEKVITFFSETNSNEPFMDTKKILDFTPGVICLSKIFEHEINLSIVQWIRQTLGIDLPAFFNKPQRGIKADYLPDNPNSSPINFNKRRNDLWLPPGIGQSEIAFSELSRKFEIEMTWGKKSSENLKKFWSEIRIERNKAAHAQIVNKESLNRTINALNQLSDHKIFQKLSEIKLRLKG